jgi:hypothetical protein
MATLGIHGSTAVHHVVNFDRNMRRIGFYKGVTTNEIGASEPQTSSLHSQFSEHAGVLQAADDSVEH